jgi:hypothetical protein
MAAIEEKVANGMIGEREGNVLSLAAMTGEQEIAQKLNVRNHSKIVKVSNSRHQNDMAE